MSSIAGQRVVFVRHGESQVTVDRVIGGHRTCTGLSPLGRQQAERLRDRLGASGELAHARLIATNYARAQETASIISSAFDDPSFDEDADFGEHDPGPLCDGMTFDDYVARFGDGPDWHDLHADVFPGGGETKAMFNLRVGSALSRVLAIEPKRDLVIVCHAGVIGSIFRELLRLPAVGVFDLDVRNTSLTEFTTGSERWRLVRYNDAAHLDGLVRETPLPPVV